MFAEVENCGEFQSGGSDSHLISTQDSTTHIVTCDVGHKTCKDLGHFWYFPGYLSSGCCHCDAGCDHSLETGTDCATKYRTATGHGDELTRDIGDLNLEAWDYFRFQVIFDLDTAGGGVNPTAPRPSLDHLRVQFEF